MKEPKEYIRELETKLVAEGHRPVFVLLGYQLAENPDGIEYDVGFKDGIPDPHVMQVIGEHFIKKAQELRERYEALRTVN
jgi:hypothetical protein